MSIGINNFTPVRLFTQACNWVSDKTKEIGGFFSSKLSGVVNTSKKMHLAAQEGKAWKLNPEKRNEVFQAALKQVRFVGGSGIEFAPKCSGSGNDTSKKTPLNAEGGNAWKSNPEKRNEVYQAALQQVRFEGGGRE